MKTTSTPEQGQLVRVRSRQWVVNEVKPSSLPAPALKLSFDGAQHLLTLASVEDDGLGEELQVVWEVEPGAKVGRFQRTGNWSIRQIQGSRVGGRVTATLRPR